MPIASAAKGLAAGLLLLALAGCGLSLPGRGGAGSAPPASAIAGEVIETSVLPEAGIALAPAAEAAEAAAEVAQPVTIEPAADTAAADPAAQIAMPEPAPVIPPALSAAAAACAKIGGRYASRGTGRNIYACFTTPRDAGKSCNKSGDCSSACLARSLSCAPLQPLFGCHEVLTDRGQRVTQCIE
ncbi:hypothetical protein GVY41_11720 [Frigidibacter albus]|uniref:Uncharacterized protein n=1 Tax=Frigidibacter albus TaxID=1465486 RepID=A0A6L8VHP4_9RHOB|nr:hypothetical protein [Frigidibacter albus]MZQ89958.1 hypothetical protein [Frigidibacter albus]NBE31667.1 hypothetical protein [Frigidibacter albus]GGH55791.1 hypothetical protein GCM10011341_23640 [Frigidibacter albus]